MCYLNPEELLALPDQIRSISRHPQWLTRESNKTPDLPLPWLLPWPRASIGRQERSEIESGIKHLEPVDFQTHSKEPKGIQ